MDIWTAPIGAEADLPALRTATDAVARLATHGTLDALHWYPTTGEAGKVRVHACSPDGRLVTLRLYTVGGEPLADVRLRRGAAPGPTTLVDPVPAPGDRVRRRFEVTASMLTDHVPGRDPVLTTPDLIAFLEDTAADVLRPRFTAGVSSLGTWIGIRHTGPARRGEHVDVTAEVLLVRGRAFTFDVRAHVGDREIGIGQVGQTLIRSP